MPTRRAVLTTVSVGMISIVAGCGDSSSSDNEDERREELYDETLEMYRDGRTEFNTAMGDFEYGERLFSDEDYTSAEQQFRNAEQGFEAADELFSDVRSHIRELEELNSVTGDSEDLIEQAREVTMAFSTYSEFHKEDSIQAQDNPRMGELKFEATQQTIEDEGHPRRVPDPIELTAEFIE